MYVSNLQLPTPNRSLFGQLSVLTLLDFWKKCFLLDSPSWTSNQVYFVSFVQKDYFYEICPQRPLEVSWTTLVIINLV